MGFLSLLVLLGIAYLVWRVTDQLPDLIFRLSEIQRDVAELRRRAGSDEPAGTTTSTQAAAPEPAAPKKSARDSAKADAETATSSEEA